MIEHSNIDERQRILQSLGDTQIRLRRFDDPRRMIVVEDDGGGVVGREGVLHHDARMHRGSIDGAPEQLFNGDDAMTVVEEDATENLVGFFARVTSGEVKTAPVR